VYDIDIVYYLKMSLAPLEYRNLCDFIFKFIENRKYLYGSKEFGQISYQCCDHSLELSIQKNLAVVPGIVTNIYTLKGPSWTLEKKIEWPVSSTSRLPKWKENTFWNGHIIEDANSWNGCGTDITVNLSGDVEDFKSIATLLYLQQD